jgi:hypothetical protein
MELILTHSTLREKREYYEFYYAELEAIRSKLGSHHFHSSPLLHGRYVTTAGLGLMILNEEIVEVSYRILTDRQPTPGHTHPVLFLSAYYETRESYYTVHSFVTKVLGSKAIYFVFTAFTRNTKLKHSSNLIHL